MLEGRALTRVEAIVLDLDDTVFDAGAWNAAALRYGARLRGMDLATVDRAIENFLRTGSPHDPALYNAILLGCFQCDNGLNVRALHEAALSYDGADQQWEPYPGVREALQDLAQHYHLTLMAEGPVEAQRAKLRALRLERAFEHIIFTDEIDGARSRRPDPRPFQLLREKLDLQGRQILFVGDQPARDFKEPHRQSFVTCRVFSGASRAEPYPDATHRADYEVTSLARLPELLASSQRSLSGYLLSQLPFLDQIGRPEAAIAAELQHEVASQLNLDLSMAATLVTQAELQSQLEAALPQSAQPLPAEMPIMLAAALPARHENLRLLPCPPPEPGQRHSRPRPLLRESISRRMLQHRPVSAKDTAAFSLD